MVVTTPVMIWVGVLPDTLKGGIAFHSSSDILDLLNVKTLQGLESSMRATFCGYNVVSVSRWRSEEGVAAQAIQITEDERKQLGLQEVDKDKTEA